MVRLIGVLALVAMAQLGGAVIGGPAAHADGLLGEVVSNLPVTGTTPPAGPLAPVTEVVDTASEVAETVAPLPPPAVEPPPVLAPPPAGVGAEQAPPTTSAPTSAAPPVPSAPVISDTATAADAPPVAAPPSSSAPSGTAALTSAPAELVGALVATPPPAGEAPQASPVEGTTVSPPLPASDQTAASLLERTVGTALTSSPGTSAQPTTESLIQPVVSQLDDAPGLVAEVVQEPLTQPVPPLPVQTLLDAPALGAIAGEQGLVPALGAIAGEQGLVPALGAIAGEQGLAPALGSIGGEQGLAPALVEPVLDATSLLPQKPLDVTNLLATPSLVLEPVVEGLGPVIELATGALVPVFEMATPLVHTTTTFLAGTMAQVLTPAGNSAEALVAPLIGAGTTAAVTTALPAPPAGLDSTLDTLLPPAGATPPQASAGAATSVALPTVGESDNAGYATVVNHAGDADEDASATRGQAFQSAGDAPLSPSPEGLLFEASVPVGPGFRSEVHAALNGGLASSAMSTPGAEFAAVPDASPFPNSIASWLRNTVGGGGGTAPISGAGFAATLIAIFAVHTAFVLARKVFMDGRALSSLTLTPIPPPG